MRDDFSQRTKDGLAARAGHRCSNPNCRRPTTGAQQGGDGAVSIGVAAHVTAASPGGPRYDPRLSSAERGEWRNGIWLCQNCAKLVDSDASHYTADDLRKWREMSEEASAAWLDPGHDPLSAPDSDGDLVAFFCKCFDRPAFQDPFMQEGRMEAFDRAMEDTITAVNTGSLYSRDDRLLAQAGGKSRLRNVEWRQQLDTAVDLLRAIRARYRLAVEQGEIRVGEDGWYCIASGELAAWMDGTRQEAVGLLASVCRQAGVPPPPRLMSRFPGRAGW